MQDKNFQSGARRFNPITVIKYYLLAGLLLAFARVSVGQDKPLQLAKPLEQGHSHNDYWRSRPLLDALNQGFKSVEADVFLVDGALLVGHSKNELSPAKTLESMYLKPLQNIARENKKLYQQPSVLYLYIDFKTEGKNTYESLVPVLARYQNLLVNPLNKSRSGMVRVILTGNYPQEQVLADKQRLVFLDGKVENLSQNLNPAFFPVVSGNWAKYFTWKGEGAMPAAETRQLAEWAALAQKNGQQIRFWNMPEQSRDQINSIWQELLKYPAILIGTDHLDWLTGILTDRNK
ncbi:hypothetical protein AAE02nite_33940 [Adhaeribacter aerolatus]|uniref:Altered inheritance of mitochondria protein 6 n=1 Tax=Adhaeribacter aerolatus TaxID=670289 RepID=A0A512B195_9BACT|nr:hypothetical protein [Adhaeribacter aerolatus]GEO05730.1 hypothetical protein AAE02nite_33940 [Adhaeribacter aerolatus]